MSLGSDPIQVPFVAPPAAPLAPRRRWDVAEVSYLKMAYPSHDPVRDLSDRLERSVRSIRSKALRLGLRRPKHARECAPTATPLPAALPVPLPEPAPPPAPLALRKPKPFRLTQLGGREIVWSPETVPRLVRLWVAGFHHSVIAQVLGITERAASSKANRISLPPRDRCTISKDLAEAFRVDAEGGPIPKTLKDRQGRPITCKNCRITGNLFYAPQGTRTSFEAKQTVHYQRMQQVSL